VFHALGLGGNKTENKEVIMPYQFNIRKDQLLPDEQEKADFINVSKKMTQVVGQLDPLRQNALMDFEGKLVAAVYKRLEFGDDTIATLQGDHIVTCRVVFVAAAS